MGEPAIGHVRGFRLDAETRELSFVVVGTGPWHSGRSALLPPTVLTGIHGPEGVLARAVPGRKVRERAAYDAEEPVDAAMDRRVREFYAHVRA